MILRKSTYIISIKLTNDNLNQTKQTLLINIMQYVFLSTVKFSFIESVLVDLLKSFTDSKNTNNEKSRIYYGFLYISLFNIPEFGL